MGWANWIHGKRGSMDIPDGFTPGDAAELRAGGPASLLWRTWTWFRVHRQAIVPLCVALLAITFLWPIVQSPKMYGDSPGYIERSTYRLPTYGAFLSLVGHGPFLCSAQTVVSVLAWCFCGWTLAGIPGTALGAGLALSLPIAQWNLMVLSESLSFSLIAMAMGMTVLLLRVWSPQRFAWWSLFVLAAAFSRLCNLYLLPVLPLAFLFGPWRRFVLTAAVALSIHMTGVFLCNMSELAAYRRVALTDVIMFRILPDPDARAYFAARGMPCGPEVMQHAGQVRSRNRNALYQDSPAFQEWLAQRGVSVYQRWLVTHWASFRDAGKSIAEFRTQPASYGRRTKPRPVSARFTAFYAFIGKAPVWIWLLALVLPLADWLTTRRVSPLCAMGAMLVLATYAEAFVCFNGECDEMTRLMMPVGILYRMTLGVALAASVDWLRRLVSARSPGTTVRA
jgi:hypothetical protein